MDIGQSDEEGATHHEGKEHLGTPICVNEKWYSSKARTVSQVDVPFSLVVVHASDLM